MHPPRTVGHSFAVYLHGRLTGRVARSSDGYMALCIHGAAISAEHHPNIQQAIRFAKGRFMTPCHGFSNERI